MAVLLLPAPFSTELSVVTSGEVQTLTNTRRPLPNTHTTFNIPSGTLT